MPELPEVERLRRTLQTVMGGAQFERVLLNRPDLRRPFPPGFARRLRRQTVRALTRRGKYLLAELSSGDTLIMHLGMSGWFRVVQTGAPPRTPARSLAGAPAPRSAPSQARRARLVKKHLKAAGSDRTVRRDRDANLENRHDHVLFMMSSGKTVIFNDPRRFGVMDLVSANGLPGHPSLGLLGPEPLARAFDARALAGRSANRRVALKVALLDQRIVAGIGNIYASEALHLAGLSPFRLASTIATAAGAPHPRAGRLAAAIKSVLRRAISLKESDRYRESRFRVYEREGERCPTPGCRGTIVRAWQAGRSTFYCPKCQR